MLAKRRARAARTRMHRRGRALTMPRRAFWRQTQKTLQDWLQPRATVEGGGEEPPKQPGGLRHDQTGEALYRTKAGILLAEVFPLVRHGCMVHPELHLKLPIASLRRLVQRVLDAAIASGHRFTAGKA